MKPSFIRFIFFASVAALFSCNQESDKEFTVKGTIKNIEKLAAQYPALFRNDSMKVFLYEVPFGNDSPPVQLDSAYVTSKSNSFTLSGQPENSGMLDVMLENGPMIPLINDVNDISLEIDLDNKEQFYTVKGSKASQQLRDFIAGYSERSNLAEHAFKNLDSLKLINSNDSALLGATNQKNNSLEAINTYSKQFLSTVDHPQLSTFILGTISATLPTNEFEAELNRQLQKFPGDSNLQHLRQQFEARKAQINAQQQKQNENSWVGKKAPELLLPDKNGKPISLSSFKGKYVLVDFWASWCKPCREENPNVVKAFNEFKNKNFTILGVSLDREKQNWLEAIEQDRLSWTHVSDLAFWDSKAVEIYKFEGIPFNVLIDPSGTVVAENLRGDQLKGKLSEVLN